MASPVAVPPPARRPLMAARTVVRSDVGGTSTLAVLAKDTSPSWTPGGRAPTKPRAACWAAASLLGVTSLATMEPETSRVRMTVARWRGVRRARAGWAKPTTSRPRAPRRAAAGMWRCQPERRGATEASMSTLVKRTTSRRRVLCTTT